MLDEVVRVIRERKERGGLSLPALKKELKVEPSKNVTIIIRNSAQTFLAFCFLWSRELRITNFFFL